MGRNLTNLAIQDTYEGLVQISGSQLTDGTGSLIENITATASYAITASYAENTSQTFDTGSLLTTASISDDTLTFTKGDASTFDLVVNNVNNATYAQNTITTGKNLEATQIDKGTPLYFTGSGTSGNIVGVYRADASNPARMPAGGIAGEDITAGAEGVVLLDGYIGGVDTSLFASGDKVYVGVGGGYTNVAPTGSANLIQVLGNVEKSAVNGSGVIQMNGESRQLPNLQAGYLWVGGAGDVPQAVSSASLVPTTASYALTALTASNVVAKSDSLTSAERPVAYLGGTTFAGDSTENPKPVQYNTSLTYNPGTNTLTKLTGSTKLSSLDVYATLNAVDNPDITLQTTGQIILGNGGSTMSINKNTDLTGSLNVSAGITGSLLGTASFADSATSASHAVQADNATTADSATTATTASHALIAEDLTSDANINISSISASNASFQSASIGYLQTITGSATIIGDAFIIVNTDTPTQRYAGIKVYDSGSPATAPTASFYYDSVNNDWNYEYSGSDATNFGVAIFGAEYSTQGSPVYPTNNALQKGMGGHHIVDSNISDDGTTITLSGSRIIGGSGVQQGVFLATYGTLTTGSFNNGASIAVGNATLNGAYNNFVAGGDGLTTGGNNTAVIGGSNNQANVDKAVVAGGENNTIDAGSRHFIGGGNANAIDSSGDGAIIGASEGYISSFAIRSAVVGGEQNQVHQQRSVVLGGFNNRVDVDAVSVGDSAVIAGKNNRCNDFSGSVVLGGDGITANAHHTTFTPNLHLTGSGGGTLTFADGTTMTTAPTASLPFPYTGSAGISGSLDVVGDTTINGNIIISGSNRLLGEGTGVSIGVGAPTFSLNTNMVALGGVNTTIGSSTNFRYGIIAGGGNNNVGNTNATMGQFVALGGNGNSMNGADDAFFIGGGSNDVQAGADRGGILGGTSNVANHARSVVIGGSSLSTSKADEVVVPNLSTNGAVVQNVEAITITSNTGSLDASLGNLFAITLQSGVDTHIELSNQVAGQTFMLKITNNAVSAGTISFDSQFEFENGTPFTATATTNAVDILTFTCFGGNVQCVGSKNFS